MKKTDFTEPAPLASSTNETNTASTRENADRNRDIDLQSADTDGNGRPLGAFEHLFWLMDQNRPVHFVMAAQIAGKARESEWRNALDLVQERHPLLSVRIDGTPGSAPRFRRVNGAPIALRVVNGEPEPLWEAVVAEEMVTPFDASQAPLVRAILIQGGQRSAFIVAAHHSIADATSIAYVIRDILQALGGNPLEALRLPPSQENLLGLDTSRVAGADGAGEPRKEGPAGTSAAYRPDDHARPQVRGRRLPAALTARLRERAREEGATVHGALCAALVFAGREMSIWRENPVRIISPTNTRSLFGIGEDCGVFVCAAAHALDAQATDFWNMARQVRADVVAAQERESVQGLISGLQLVVGNGLAVDAAARFTASAFAREAMLTNLGQLPFGAQFGPLKLEALWGPAVLSGFEAEHTVGVVTINGSLCLTHSSHVTADRLLDLMTGFLRAACSM